MTTAALPPVAAPAPTLSLIYAEDGWDWATATDLELTIEAGYLREALRREDSAAAREELKRIRCAATLRGLNL